MTGQSGSLNRAERHWLGWEEMRELIEEVQPEHAVPDDLRAHTVPQAAAMLGLSEVYLRVMLKRGDIRSVKAGRRVPIPATAIREFLAPPRSPRRRPMTSAAARSRSTSPCT